MDFSQTLTLLMEKNKLTSAKLARLTGVPQPVVYRLASGETHNPKVASILPIAKYFGVSVEQLIGEKNIPGDQEPTNQPSSSSQATAIPVLTQQEILSSSNHSSNSFFYCQPGFDAEDCFAYRLTEETLTPYLPKNTLLIFTTNKKPEHLDYVLIQTSNHSGLSLKKLIIDAGDYYLKPLDPNLRTIFIEDQKTLNICGVLTSANINFLHNEKNPSASEGI